MKLTFKDLKQEKFTLDAEATETIGEIKEKLAKSRGWEKNLIKLIYSGKVLQDTQTVEASKYEEKGFIVCMVSKPPKPAAAPVPATPSAQISSTPANVPPTPQPQGSTPSAPAPPATPTPAGPTEQGGALGSSALASNGAEREAAIANMQSMGFERAQIDAAMQAAFWNPDRAVEYLLNGIPDHLQRPARPAASTQAPPTTAPVAQTNTTNPPPVADATHDPAAQAAIGDEDEGINLFDAAANARNTGGRTTATGAAGDPGSLSGAQGQGMNLDFLRGNQQFQQLRSLIQSQPGYLEQILQSVAASNPGLAQMIGQNPEQFLQLLGEDDGEDAPVPPGMQQVTVTEEESQAIDRLCTLGFNRDAVIQAYFACEKNEELAANFLFDQGDDFEEGPPQ